MTTPPITKESRETLKAFGNAWDRRNAVRVIREFEAALTAAEEENARLREAKSRWREDAAARLEMYLALRDKSLIGSATQVDVSLIMPTLAMVEADASGTYDWSDVDAVDLDAVVARARAALEGARQEGTKE